jgi:hypothetical protein
MAVGVVSEAVPDDDTVADITGAEA